MAETTKVRAMPVRLRHRASVLALAAVLAAPGAALAQGGGAGEEQYQDPFGGEEPQEQPAPEPAPTAAPAPAAPAPAPATTGESAAESAPAPAPAASSGGGDELPRTGAPAGLVAAAGLALLAGGLLLRRRSSRDGA
jgi:LPXTG-motif cell wall-anchored protein